MRSYLPITFILLLWTSPALSQSTSLNDPFRILTAHAPKPKLPENPICCLKPLTPPEPVDDDVLLSFEEWKTKQLGMQKASTTEAEEMDAYNRAAAVVVDGSGRGGDAGNVNDSTVSPTEDNNGGASSTASSTQERTSFSPSKAPLTDRFNYASSDCSARVHTSHRSAKSPSAILSSKRDRYMLSPCDTPNERQHVVVELCDDIRIDTIQLANFEFFSGVFKDFSVSVAKTYTNDPDAWTAVQTYRAKNTRGVQTFRPPDDLLDFYRFIRIDFHSHYGSEYYCPVSLLRVYGLTHLEEWKTEIWESESRAKQAELQKKRQHVSAISPPVHPVSGSTSQSFSINESIHIETPPTVNTPKTAERHPSPSSSYSVTARSSPPVTAAERQTPPDPLSVATVHPTEGHSNTPTTDYAHDLPLHERSIYTSVTPPFSNSHIPTQSNLEDNVSKNIPTSSKTDTAMDTNYPSSTPLPTPVLSQSVSHAAPPSQSVQSNPVVGETSTVVVSSHSPSVAVIPVVPVHTTPKGGESIYRTILNRVSEVEMNQTLYVRYVEQQNLAIREVMKRLVEDVGRLEGITRAHAMNYQRNLDSWQRQRALLEMEYLDLVMRVEHLSEEIIMEKRLGVAQLCLLLAVLVFMGLTRGSRAGALIDNSSTRLNQSVRQWGERHLKLSNNWTDRFKSKSLSIDLKRANDESIEASSKNRSPSSTPSRTPQTITRPLPISSKSYPVSSRHKDRNDGVTFPTKSPLDEMDINTAPAYSENFPRTRTRTLSNSNPRSRAPSLRSTPVNRRIHHQRPMTPITAAFRPPLLQRSSSHHGGGAGGTLPLSSSWGVPKSAKKWARTAHLHEVKAAHPAKRTRKRSGENVNPIVGEKLNKGKEKRVDAYLQPFDFDAPDLGSRGDTRFDALTLPPSSTGRSGEAPAFESSLLFKPPGTDSTPVDEGDAWVDTDSVDGSELDAEGPAGGGGTDLSSAECGHHSHVS